MNYWLTILHVREYENDKKSPKETSSDFPPPRWDLVVTLKQLLRNNHRRRSTLHSPRPSTMGFSDNPELRNAGIIPLSTTEIKQLTKELAY